MTRLGSLAAVSFACVLAWGCHDRSFAPIQPSVLIVGSGRVATESRPLSGFSTISVSLTARVVVIQSGTESLSVTAEDNILPLVRTEVVGSRLVLTLAAPGSISTTREILVEVSARTVSAIDVEGATRLELTGLQADAFSLQASGASQITGSGTVRDLRLNLSGSVRCRLDGLGSRFATAAVSGTSYAGLKVADSLTATASGVSVVEDDGDPVVVANISGLSAVRRLGP